ncbi:MAG: VCBS repeat-containing protein, partial [bacterium]
MDSTAAQALSALHFVDGTAASGLGTFQQRNGSADKNLIHESFAAGLALVDLNGDGHLDVYLTNGGPEQGSDESVANALYFGDGQGHFTEVTQGSGVGDTLWSYGVNAVDFDGDSDLDLYVTNRGPNRLYRNDGTGHFEDVAADAGVAVEEWSTGSVFFDYDRDGDLDLYVVNHIDFDLQSVHEQGLRMHYFNQEVYYGPLGLDG